MPGPESRAELTGQKPFVIRAHHLAYFMFLTSPHFRGAAENARELRDSIRANPSPEYTQDVLGLSPEDADKFEEHIRQASETFLALPDNHPAEIVEGILDVICEACAIGEHCRRLGTGEDNFITFDRVCLDDFIRDLNELKLPQPTIIYEQAYFSDAKPQRTKRIKTTIGIIKTVSRFDDFLPQSKL